MQRLQTLLVLILLVVTPAAFAQTPPSNSGGAFGDNSGGAFGGNFGGAFGDNFGGAFGDNFGGAFGDNFGGAFGGNNPVPNPTPNPVPNNIPPNIPPQPPIPPAPQPNPFVNQPPVLNPIGNYFIPEGQLLTFFVGGFDPENQPVIFSASNVPSGATFASQTFSWTPDFNQQGTYLITFAITDNLGQQDSETVQITVFDATPPVINSPPTFLSDPVLTAFVRDLYYSQVIVFDPDGDDVELSLATAPAGMTLSYLESGYTVFSSWIDTGETESETAITGDTFTVTMNAVTADTCDVTINNIRRTVPYQAGQVHQITVDGATYTFTVDPDTAFDDCYVEIIDSRITSGWLLWTPEPSQIGQNPVRITASDGEITVAQNFNVTVTIDPRLLPREEEPRTPRKDVRVNTIALPDSAVAGEMVLVTLNFENSGDLKLDGAEATLSIPELGIRSPTIGPLDLRINKQVSRTLVLEIPEETQDGLYTVRLTIDSGPVHRIVHRDIEIISD